MGCIPKSQMRSHELVIWDTTLGRVFLDNIFMKRCILPFLTFSNSLFFHLIMTAVVVMQTATVQDLKSAIKRYFELKQDREEIKKKISWWEQKLDDLSFHFSSRLALDFIFMIFIGNFHSTLDCFQVLTL